MYTCSINLEMHPFEVQRISKVNLTAYIKVMLYSCSWILNKPIIVCSTLVHAYYEPLAMLFWGTLYLKVNLTAYLKVMLYSCHWILNEPFIVLCLVFYSYCIKAESILEIMPYQIIVLLIVHWCRARKEFHFIPV